MNSPKNKLAKLLKTLAVTFALTGAVAAQTVGGSCPYQNSYQEYQPTHGTYGEFQSHYGSFGEYQPNAGTYGINNPQATFGSGQAQQVGTPSPSIEDNIAFKILDLTNQQRAQNGLAPLIMNPALNEAAKTHSEEMLTLNYFSHNSPTVGRRSVKDRMLLAGVSPRVQFENIFMSQGFPTSQLAQLSMDQWMQSPGHRRNILRSEVSHIGIGVVERQGKYYATQVFGGGM